MVRKLSIFNSVGWILAMLGVGFFGAGFSGSALAGECDKVRSSYAEAVCNTPQIAADNLRMEAAFESLMANLSDANQKLLAAGHKNWREYARIACTLDGKLQESVYEGYPLECIADLIEERKNWLENDWSVGGAQTFPQGTFAAMADPNPGVGPAVGSFTYSAVVLDETSELGTAFNAFVRDGYGGGLLHIEYLMAEFTGDTQVKTSVSIYEITSKRISSVVDEYAYYHGAAHGASYIGYEHFLTAELRPLEASDIFVGSSWQSRLNDLALEQMRSDPELIEQVFVEVTDVSEYVVDQRRWRFTPEGLQIQFQPYEIAAYVFGLPTVTLAWEDLGDILAPGALTIAISE